MTRRLTVLLLLCTHFSVIAYSADRGLSTMKAAGLPVTVKYGRPELGGRDMLGRAQQGMVWRLGMNQTTTLTTEGPLMLGDTKVDTGIYSLLAECTGEDSWRLIVNSVPELRGSNRDPAKDVALVPLQTSKVRQSVEILTISLTPTGETSGELSIEWGNRALKAAFKAAE